MLEIEELIADRQLGNGSRSSESEIFEPYREVVLKETYGLSAKINGIEDSSNIFASDANVLDVYDIAVAKNQMTELIIDLKREYIAKLEFLRKFFGLPFLQLHSLEVIRSLHMSVEVIVDSLNSKKLTKANLTEEAREVARAMLIESDAEIGSDPVTARWGNIADRQPEEKAIDFLVRVWGEKIESGEISRSDLSSIDASLSGAIRQFYSRRTRGSKKKEDALEGLPRWLRVWFEAKAIRSKSEVTLELKKYNISKPEDAFHRNLPEKEAQRLYNACKRRSERVRN